MEIPSDAVWCDLRMIPVATIRPSPPAPARGSDGARACYALGRLEGWKSNFAPADPTRRM